MVNPDFTAHCSACGKLNTFYLSQVSPKKIQEENQRLKAEKLYLNRVCESLNERLAEVESMAAWDNLDGAPIANLF